MWKRRLIHENMLLYQYIENHLCHKQCTQGLQGWILSFCHPCFISKDPHRSTKGWIKDRIVPLGHLIWMQHDGDFAEKNYMYLMWGNALQSYPGMEVPLLLYMHISFIWNAQQFSSLLKTNTNNSLLFIVSYVILLMI